MRRSTLVASSDPELAARGQAGDGQALDVLIDRYRRFSRSRARGYFMTGGDADDVEQEALIGLYKAARDFRPEHEVSFRGFAELCITRQILSAIKAATRQKHRALNQYVSISGVRGGDDSGERAIDELLPERSGADPAERIVARERLDAVRAAMADRFSELEMEVLSLHADGHSYVEIGHQTGRHTKCVDNTLQRIKRKLAACLAEEAERGVELVSVG